MSTPTTPHDHLTTLAETHKTWSASPLAVRRELARKCIDAVERDGWSGAGGWLDEQAKVEDLPADQVRGGTDRGDGPAFFCLR